MIEYTSDKMPFIPTMYDINDLFANFTNNWFHLRYVFSLLFGIMFGFYLMKKILEGLGEFMSITEAAWRVKDRVEQAGERMKMKAGISAEIAKDKFNVSMRNAAEKSSVMMDRYKENYMQKMEFRHEAKFNFNESLDQQKEEQRQAVVFLAGLAARKERAS